MLQAQNIAAREIRQEPAVDESEVWVETLSPGWQKRRRENFNDMLTGTEYCV